MADPTTTMTQIRTDKYPPYQDRVPSKPRDNGVPIEELVASGEPVQHVRKKLVYEYRPLYTIALLVFACMFLWATAYTIEQLSDNATARACFAADGEWQINEQGKSECTGTGPQRGASVTDGATVEP